MNDPGKQPEKQFRRRLILICAGATPILVLSSLCSVRGRPVLGLILALLCTAGGALLFFLAAKARDRKLSAGMKPLSEIRSELSAPAETERAVPELFVQQIGGLNDKRYYRVIEGPEQYHFIMVPSPPFSLLQPTPEAFAQTVSAQGTDEETRARYRRGFTVDKQEVQLLEIRAGYFRYQGAQMLNCGEIKLRTAKRKRVFLLVELPMGRTELDATRFFDAVRSRIRVDASELHKTRKDRQKAIDRANAVLAETADTQNPDTARVLRRVLPTLDFASLVLMFAAMFIDLLRPNLLNTVISVVLLALALITWAALLLAPRYVSTLGMEWPEQSLLEQSGVTFVCPFISLFVPGGTLGIVFANTITPHILVPTILWGVGLSALAVILLYLRTPQARRFLSSFIAVWVLCAMFSLGPALAINRLFDWRAPEAEQVQLLAQQNGELTYRDESGALKTGSPDLLALTENDWEYGQKAELVRHSGALGIGWEELRFD